MTAGAEGDGDGAAGAKRALPLLYKSLLPMNRERHAGSSVLPRKDYAFARAAHAVPLQTQEFEQAARCFPIVFSAGKSPMPIAVLGVKDNVNLFVDAAGKWDPVCYVPAYIRRYPFACARRDDSQELVLMMDEASEFITGDGAAPGAKPLFEGGKPSKATTAARDFCLAYEQQLGVTKAFAAAAVAQSLMISRDVACQLPSGQKHVFTGLTVIDADKFNALPDQVFLEWRRQAWLPLVYWHFLSLGHFASLFHRGQAAASAGAPVTE